MVRLRIFALTELFLFCNVLHIWTIRTIPTFRVNRYDYFLTFMVCACLYTYTLQTLMVNKHCLYVNYRLHETCEQNNPSHLRVLIHQMTL